MKTKEIKQLIEILESSNLETMTYKESEFEVTLGKPRVQEVPVQVQTLASAPVEVPIETKEVETIKSPIVGIFYDKPTPDSAPFVKVGSRIEKGDVIAIVEAMKVMNEIKSDVSGTVKTICVKDGDMVEYQQPLFEI